MNYDLQVCPNCELHFETEDSSYYTCPFCNYLWQDDSSYVEEEPGGC